jgi:hypothetical protein
MYAEALAARPRARIKKSDNEYVEGESREILHELKMAIKSVRPAARAEALTDFCDKHNITCLPMPTKTKQAVLLYDLTSYSADKEHYDQIIQSNGIMVQAAKTGATICRGRSE